MTTMQLVTEAELQRMPESSVEMAFNGHDLAIRAGCSDREAKGLSAKEIRALGFYATTLEAAVEHIITYCETHAMQRLSPPVADVLGILASAGLYSQDQLNTLMRSKTNAEEF